VLRYLVRRVLAAIPLLLVASFLTFCLTRAAYDPLAKYRHQRDSRRVLAEQQVKLGLDHSILQQWWDWLTHFVRGDMGTSSRTGDAVSSMIGHALWPSIQLMFWATIVSVIVAIALGVYSAVKQYSIGDYFFTGLSYVGIAMPDFWFALMAIALLVTGPTVWFHLNEPIFYSIGLHSEGVSGLNLDYFRHLALPVLTLTFTSVAAWSRYLRAETLGVLHNDYVRTARAKGVPRRQVVTKHAVRNALIPFTTVTALDTAFLIGGVVIVERIFSIPGMGQAFLDALQAGDAPFLLSWFVIAAGAVVLFNLIADVIYVVLDPRIRLS
jgi:peptide/nickel transport system permease protein